MRRKKNNSNGFTMAELLAVVAIIVILAGVGFIALQAHQRNLAQIEMDSIAKEIFVAAQNHLTMAESQNFFGHTGSGFGAPDTAINGTDGTNKSNLAYYYIKNKNSSGNISFTPDTVSIDEIILPFGAVDETVRNGNYIIRYQPESALVLDVFYCSPNGRFSKSIEPDDYSKFVNYLGGADKKSNRRNYEGSVIGWWGGEEAAKMTTADTIIQPTIEINNSEKLTVKVFDSNPGAAGYVLKLIVSGLDIDGEETGAKLSFLLREEERITADDKTKLRLSNDASENSYSVVLDDITNDNHYAKIYSEAVTDPKIEKVEDLNKTLVPGENISIQAMAYNKGKLTNVASSDVEITNSLFEKISVNKSDSARTVTTAYVNNIRHLENLEEDISGIVYPITRRVSQSGVVNLDIRKVEQTTDLSWSEFKKAINQSNPESVIITNNGGSNLTKSGCYMPVSPSYGLSYDGKNFNIFDIKVNTSSDAGLFGFVPAYFSVSNLALIDFDITSAPTTTPSTSTSTTYNAGALIGKLDTTDQFFSDANELNTSNVIAYEKNASDSVKVAGGDNAGGLIGSVVGSDARIEKSAAALIVSSDSENGNAGGLIGSIDGGTVTACYSGGHLEDVKSGSNVVGVKYNETACNVKSPNGNAGGLIGNAGSAVIKYCYSTCSVSGNIAGGLVGSASTADNNITYDSCYSTGLVKGASNSGAFAGVDIGDKCSDCKYFEIVNKLTGSDGNISYLSSVPLPTSPTPALTPTPRKISAFDQSASDYNSFSGSPSLWKSAKPYRNILTSFYQGKDNFKTVEQLKSDTDTNTDTDSINFDEKDFVTTHYGDWPAPEIFVFNTN